MKKLEQCQVEGCLNLAKYGLYWPRLDGTKKWLHVCREHEKTIGDENMRSAGGRWEKEGL